MNFVWWVLLQGPIVERVVEYLKGIPFVKNNPRLVAALVNLALVLIGYLSGIAPKQLLELIALILNGLIAPSGTHELRSQLQGER